MVETSQNDVDSLMDSMNESSVEPENDNNSETEKSQSSEDTVDSALSPLALGNPTQPYGCNCYGHVADKDFQKGQEPHDGSNARIDTLLAKGIAGTMLVQSFFHVVHEIKFLLPLGHDHVTIKF